MSGQHLRADAMARPDLFRWNGPVTSEQLEAWLGRNPWLSGCPADLLALWRETGGGDLFETETIYGPTGDPALGDDIEVLNEELRARGMPARYVAFHSGLSLSAVDVVAQEYLDLESNGFRVLRSFLSLDEWYVATLRAEYGERYGLTKPGAPPRGC